MTSSGDTRPVAVIGAALDLGAGRRGVDMGPSAIRYAGLDSAGGAARPATASTSATSRPPCPRRRRSATSGCATSRRSSRPARAIADRVEAALEADRLPLVLGGDHSVAIGTLGGLARVNGPGGVLWVDAHGDLNRPETSPTGNVHGMALAAALGLAGAAFEAEGVPMPSRRPEPGRARRRPLARRRRARAPAGAERDRVHDERRRPARDRARDPRVARARSGPGFVHVSLDMDAVDPDVAPGVGTPVRGGLSYREAHLAMELVAESGPDELARGGRGEPDPRP